MLLVMSMLSAASMLVQTPDIGPRWPNGLGSCYCSTTLPGDTAHPAGYCPDPVECGGAFPTQGTAGWPEVPARLQPETFYSACEAALWSAYIDKRRAAEEAYHDCIDGSGNANRKIVLAYPNQPYPCITPGGTTPGYPWYNNCNHTTDAPDCRYGVYFPCDVISSCWDTLIATLDAAYAEYRHLVFTTCEGLACDYAEDGSLLYPTLGPVAGDTPSSSCYLTYVSCMQDAYDVYAAAVAVSQGDCDLIDAAVNTLHNATNDCYADYTTCVGV